MLQDVDADAEMVIVANRVERVLRDVVEQKAESSKRVLPRFQVRLAPFA